MFSKLKSRDRSTAILHFNQFRALIERYTEEASELDGQPEIDLWEYVGFTEYVTDEYTTLTAWETSLRIRRQSINAVIEEMDRRAARRDAMVQKGKRGRPRKHAKYLSKGQLLFFGVAYNHGAGATFERYIGSAPTFDPIPIQDYADFVTD